MGCAFFNRGGRGVHGGVSRWVVKIFFEPQITLMDTDDWVHASLLRSYAGFVILGFFLTASSFILLRRDRKEFRDEFLKSEIRGRRSEA